MKFSICNIIDMIYLHYHWYYLFLVLLTFSICNVIDIIYLQYHVHSLYILLLVDRDTETWLGITNSALGLRWMDCRPLNFSLFAHFKDANNIQFKTDEQCYMTKKSSDFAAERKSCESTFGAICVQPIQGMEPKINHVRCK